LYFLVYALRVGHTCLTKDQEFQVLKYFTAVKHFKYTSKHSNNLHFMRLQNPVGEKGKTAPMP